MYMSRGFCVKKGGGKFKEKLLLFCVKPLKKILMNTEIEIQIFRSLHRIMFFFLNPIDTSSVHHYYKEVYTSKILMEIQGSGKMVIFLKVLKHYVRKKVNY